MRWKTLTAIAMTGWASYSGFILATVLAERSIPPMIHNTVLAGLVCLSIGAMIDHSSQRSGQRSGQHEELGQAYLSDAADLFELGRQAERRQGRNGI